MDSYRIIPHELSQPFETALQELAGHCRKEGTTQELMVAMAAVMQQEMTHHQVKHILPHSGGIDCIMRAVEHTLRGDSTANRYVLQKLNFGVSCLNNWLA